MGKEMREIEEFKSGKELLEMCIRKLNENQQGKTGGNRALYPTLIIFMGEKSCRYLNVVKNTLDDNWDNAGFLQYINVFKQEKEYRAYRAVNMERRNECEWDTSNPQAFEKTLNEAMEEMLEKEDRIFENKTRTKMEFVLDATDTYAEEYYKFFCKVNTAMPIRHLKTMFVMLDQRPTEECVEKSDHFLKMLVSEKQKHTTYLISNYMKSGALLGDDRIWQNYRLVSNIILLGGNKGKDVTHKERLFGGLKTVSYILLTKPTDEIARVSLKALMECIYDVAKEKNKKQITDKEIKEKLGITDINEIKWAEELYREKLLIKLPREHMLECLPFQKEYGTKQIQKRKSLTIEQADWDTMGVWKLFMERNYIQPVLKYFDLKENKEYADSLICSQIQKSFTYIDFLTLNEDELEFLLQREYVSQGGRNEERWSQKLHLLGINESKKRFYDCMKKRLKEQLEFYRKVAIEYKENYEQYQEEIEKESGKVGGEEKTIIDFYWKTVKEFMGMNGEKYVDALFALPTFKEDILKRIWEIWLKLIEKDIYTYDFESELDRRLNTLTPEQKHMFIQDKLQKNLDGSMRLKTVLDPSVRKACCYYLVNENANYAKELKKKDGFGAEFMLYSLNRTDCIEQMEIYDIEKPELLYLIKEEE